MRYVFNPFTGTFDLVGTGGAVASKPGTPTEVLPGVVYDVPEREQVLFIKRIRLGDMARIRLGGILVQAR